MSILEALRVAWQALVAHKLRSLLTMLGIIIGVGAVVGMLAVGNGYTNSIQREFTKLGLNVFYITPQVDSKETSETARARLSAADAEALLRPGAVPAIEYIALELTREGVVNAGGERFRFGVKGVTHNFFKIGDQQLGAGRHFSAAEDEAGARVAVIGKTVATTLFNSIGAAIGQRININDVQFEVIGVATTKQSQAAGALGQFGNPAEQVIVPYRTARNRLFRNSVDTRVDISSMTVRVRDASQVDESIRQATAVLRTEHRLSYQYNDFTIANPKEMMKQFTTITTGFSAFLGAIGGISLLVGGIGIMNIMLVSVAQRTREIGLRKAVGARPRDILTQFLIEAVVVCLLGGMLGVALGYLLSFAGTYAIFLLSQDPNARAEVSLSSVVLATTISAAIGIFFGFYPAMRAARLDPIKALRNE